jgi:hypothetical protein
LSKDTSSPVMSVMLNSLNVLIAPHRIAVLAVVVPRASVHPARRRKSTGCSADLRHHRRMHNVDVWSLFGLTVRTGLEPCRALLGA